MTMISIEVKTISENQSPTTYFIRWKLPKLRMIDLGLSWKCSSATPIKMATDYFPAA